MKQRLLLCGHGYLGQAISREFLAADWRVTTISLADSVADHSCDLSQATEVEALARNIPSPDFIVHCASSGRGGPPAYRAVFEHGCRHLINSFHGIPLLLTSSTSVYAQTDGSEVDEESPAEPERETGQILRQSERLVLNHEGLVFRLSGIYGPGRSVILKNFLSGQATLEADGRRIINQIHRDDAARAILHAAMGFCGPGIWNLSDSDPRSQHDTYTALAEQFSLPMPLSSPIDPLSKRGWSHKFVSNTKLRQSGWLPRHPSFLQTAKQIAPSLK